MARFLTCLAMCAAVLFGMTNTYAEIVSPEYFGLHIHRANSRTAWPKANFGSWRLWDAYVQWTHLQPTRSSWNFARLDRYVELGEANRVSLLLPLGLSPRWASARPNEQSAYGEGKAAEPASMEDWRIYVSTVAKRYKGRIKAYEIWNEPNSRDFFSGSPAKLVELTCEAYQTLKAIDPTIVVASPAFTGGKNIGKLEEFLAIGGSKCIDVVAYHLYVTPDPPEAIPPLIKTIRQAMKRQGVENFPLWNTETGWVIENTDGTSNGKVPDSWQPVSTEQSAAYIARSYLLGSAFGLDRFYWYAWDSNTFGLVEPTAGTLKPGGVALGVVARWMTGGGRPTCTLANRMWMCILSAESTEQRVVVWSPDGSMRYSVPSGWKIKQIDRADGRAEPPDSGTYIRTDDLPRLLVLSTRKQGSKH